MFSPQVRCSCTAAPARLFAGFRDFLFQPSATLFGLDRAFTRPLRGPTQGADGLAHMVLVQLGQLQPYERIVDFGGEGFEMGERSGAVSSGLGNFTGRPASIGPCAALERDGSGAFGFVEGAGALECAREPNQIL